MNEIFPMQDYERKRMAFTVPLNENSKRSMDRALAQIHAAAYKNRPEELEKRKARGSEPQYVGKKPALEPVIRTLTEERRETLQQQFLRLYFETNRDEPDMEKWRVPKRREIEESEITPEKMEAYQRAFSPCGLVTGGVEAFRISVRRTANEKVAAGETEWMK